MLQDMIAVDISIGNTDITRQKYSRGTQQYQC